MTNPHKKDKRILRTEKAFVNALIECAEHMEVKDITVGDLAESAGYSRGSFYARYESKELFLNRFLDDEIENYVNYSLSFKSKSNEWDSYDASLNLYQHVYNNKKMYILLFSSKYSSEIMQYFINRACSLINDHISFTFDSKEDELDKDLYLYISVNRHINIIKYWIDTQFKYSADYMAKQETLTRISTPIIRKK